MTSTSDRQLLVAGGSIHHRTLELPAPSRHLPPCGQGCELQWVKMTDGLQVFPSPFEKDDMSVMGNCEGDLCSSDLTVGASACFLCVFIGPSSCFLMFSNAHTHTRLFQRHQCSRSVNHIDYQNPFCIFDKMSQPSLSGCVKMFVHLVTPAEVFLVLLFLFCVTSVMWFIALLCCSQTKPEMICLMNIK